jgi:hypothetical protein
MYPTCSANGHKETASLNYEISTMWETAKDDQSEDFSTVKRPKTVTRPEPCNLYDDNKRFR